MRLLAIETAFEPCSVALWLDGDCRERMAVEPRGHAGLVLPWVEELLAEGGLALGALDAIACSRGPGSFTSLRIGISVTQGLAWGAGLGVVPVSSLQATAQTLAGSGVERALVAMDARMGEVYSGCFELRDGLMQAIGEESVGPPDALALPDGQDWSGVGNGFVRFPELATLAEGLQTLHGDAWPGAGAVAELASGWLDANEALPAAAAQPVYLRDKVADKPKQ